MTSDEPGAMAKGRDIGTVLGMAKKPWWSKRIAAVAAAGALVVIVGLFWAARTPEGGSDSYVTTPARRGNLTVEVTATGTVQPTNLVEISSELSGTVRAVYVDFNDTVKVGQVLARLDTDKLEASLERSRATLLARRAQVEDAEATVTETEAQYKRTKNLAAQNNASVQALQAATAGRDRAIAAVDLARANVKVAEADLKTDETNLAKASIKSPINGVILQRNVDVGQTVASSLQAPVLFTIAEDLSQMELQVDIDEAEVGKVHVGQQAVFTVDAYQDRQFPARISEVRFAPETIDGVVTYKAILSIDNSDLLLRPGMTATAEITVNKIPDALLVPNAALRFSPPVQQKRQSGGGLLGLLMPRRPSREAETSNVQTANTTRTVWVLRDKEPTPVQVQTGATDGVDTVIVGGPLSAGDSVITDLAGG